MQRRFAFLSVFLSLALSAGVTPAQQPNDQAQQAVARAQALLRQLAQEKATVEAEVAKLRAENARLKKAGQVMEAALAERGAELESAARETGSVRASLARKDQRLAQVTVQLREIVARYKQESTALRQAEAERMDLQAGLAATQRQLDDAENKNLELSRINREILAEFAREGTWDRFLRREPLTGLKRVQIETLVQDYDDAISEHLRESTQKRLAAPAAR